jgi:predicted aspartyl protease
MRLLKLHILMCSAALLLLTPAVSAAQTTLDLEKIRQEHASGDGKGEQSDGEDTDRQGDSQNTIRIESAGASSTSSFGGQITLPFDKRGHSMLVPATVAGKSVYFVFDTGATYTTLTPRFAASIGAKPPTDAPQTVSRTANGRRTFKFGVMPSLKLDGRVHRNVTFGSCSACGGIVYKGRPVVGLLGLNVLRRYRIDFDHSAGEVTLEPGPGFADRSADVKPWLRINRKRSNKAKAGEHETSLRVENRSQRDVRLEMSIDCKFGDGSTETIRTDPSRISAGSTETLTASSGRKFCGVRKIDVQNASW